MTFKSKYNFFSLTKMYMKISSAQWQPFCPWGDELKLISNKQTNKQLGIEICRHLMIVYCFHYFIIVTSSHPGRLAVVIILIYCCSRYDGWIDFLRPQCIIHDVYLYTDVCAICMDMFAISIFKIYWWRLSSSYQKRGMKLLFHSQTSTVAPLKFGNG